MIKTKRIASIDVSSVPGSDGLIHNFVAEGTLYPDLDGIKTTFSGEHPKDPVRALLRMMHKFEQMMAIGEIGADAIREVMNRPGMYTKAVEAERHHQEENLAKVFGRKNKPVPDMCFDDCDGCKRYTADDCHGEHTTPIRPDARCAGEERLCWFCGYDQAQHEDECGEKHMGANIRCPGCPDCAEEPKP